MARWKWEPLFNECARGVRAATVKTRPAEAESVTFDNNGGEEGDISWREFILVLSMCILCVMCGGDRLETYVEILGGECKGRGRDRD